MNISLPIQELELLPIPKDTASPVALNKLRGFLIGRIPTIIPLANFVRGKIHPQPKPPLKSCLLYTSPSPRDATLSRMPSSA